MVRSLLLLTLSNKILQYSLDKNLVSCNWMIVHFSRGCPRQIDCPRVWAQNHGSIRGRSGYICKNTTSRLVLRDTMGYVNVLSGVFVHIFPKNRGNGSNSFPSSSFSFFPLSPLFYYCPFGKSSGRIGKVFLSVVLYLYVLRARIQCHTIRFLGTSYRFAYFAFLKVPSAACITYTISNRVKVYFSFAILSWLNEIDLSFW